MASSCYPVTLGGFRFGSSAQLKTYLSRLLRTEPFIEWREVDPEGSGVLLALLRYHPNAAGKAGLGVRGFVRGHHPQFQRTRCFNLVRDDGTFEDFSFNKVCLSH
eukprot:TRINITY_DN6013_c0_g1_i2.p1 TRINITY_DN6013_c0_g1~~TRINITY_DN6013_c0_g1_i2.p1  ORF type:complete len:114 (-),score=28.45 TRINITY_DN6013_c0_g1_i2:81-395(-)